MDLFATRTNLKLTVSVFCLPDLFASVLKALNLGPDSVVSLSASSTKVFFSSFGQTGQLLRLGGIIAPILLKKPLFLYVFEGSVVCSRIPNQSYPK